MYLNIPTYKKYIYKIKGAWTMHFCDYYVDTISKSMGRAPSLQTVRY